MSNPKNHRGDTKLDGSGEPVGWGKPAPTPAVPSETARPTLKEVLDKTRNHVMSDEEHQAQRESWVRGEMALGELERGMTTRFPPAAPPVVQDGGTVEQIARKHFPEFRCRSKYTSSWYDGNEESMQKCAAAIREALASREQTIRELQDALQGIIDIGKRDMTNPKYDGYFEEARSVLATLSGKGQS